MIRTGAHYLEAFFDRVEKLNTLVPLRVIVGENDSQDTSRDMLDYWAQYATYPVTVLDCGDGSPHFSSVDDPVRWASISGVMNKVLDQLSESDDRVLYVDADLIWEPEMVVRLLAKLRPGEVDVLAPIAWSDIHNRPYDLWGTRRRGERIHPRIGWFPTVQSRGMLNVDSAACLNVMDGRWAREARFGPDNANVGWHDAMRERGARIWLDMDERVVHP